MAVLQFHPRESYHQKLVELRLTDEKFHLNSDFYYAWRRLVLPIIRRMNPENEYANEPLANNLPPSFEPRWYMYMELKDEDCERYHKCLRYHKFLDDRGQYQNTRFLEVLIDRAYKKRQLERNPNQPGKKAQTNNHREDFDPVAFATGASHDGENWGGD